MNSIWSEKEGCCVQFITCKGCHKRGKPDQLIGAEIVCVENPSQGFQKGQVRPKNVLVLFYICKRGMTHILTLIESQYIYFVLGFFLPFSLIFFLSNEFSNPSI